MLRNIKETGRSVDQEEYRILVDVLGMDGLWSWRPTDRTDENWTNT